MRRWLPALLCLCMLVLGARAADASPDQAPSEARLRMVARAGFEGVGRPGNWLPVEVEVVNEGPEVAGELQVWVEASQAQSQTSYARAPTAYIVPAQLPQFSHKRFSLAVLLPSVSDRMEARIVSDGQVLLTQEVSLDRVGASDLFCGVAVAANPEDYDFLKAMELPPPQRRLVLSRLDARTIPSHAQSLASLDCLLLDGGAAGSLTPAQVRALDLWVADGGVLVLVGGPGWQRVGPPFSERLLPVRIDGNGAVGSLEPLGSFLGTPLTLPGPFPVVQSTPMNGQLLVVQEGVPLLVADEHGNGLVFFLATAPTPRTLRDWAGLRQLWTYLLSHHSPEMGLVTLTGRPASRWGQIPRVSLGDFSDIPTPSLDWLAIVLGVYALALGPGQMLLLRVLGRPTWALVITPALVALALVTAFGGALARMEPDLLMNRVTIVQATDAGDGGIARTYIGLLSRSERTYTLRAGPDDFVTSLYYPFPRNPSGDPGAWDVRVALDPSPRVQGLALGASHLGTLLVESQLPSGQRVRASLSADHDVLDGWVRNELGQPLTDAALLVGYQVYWLGDLQSGEERHVSVPIPAAPPAGYGVPSGLPGQLLSADVEGAEAADRWKRELLESVLVSRFSSGWFLLQGPTLVGWLPTSPVGIEPIDARERHQDYTLYTAVLPVSLEPGFEGQVPSALFARKHLALPGSGRPEVGRYLLAPGDAVTVEFALPQPGVALNLQHLGVLVDGRVSGGAAARSSLGLSVYHWRSGTWHEFPRAIGTTTLPNAPEYVSAGGRVRVQLVFDPPPDGTNPTAEVTEFELLAQVRYR